MSEEKDNSGSLMDVLMKEKPEAYRRNSIKACTPDLLDNQIQRGDGDHTWDESDATIYSVRGPDYLYDRRKYPSLPSVCRCVDVDVFRCPAEVLYEDLGFEKCEAQAYDNGYGYITRPVFITDHPISFVQRARALGDTRFMFVVHFDTGTEHLVATFYPVLKPDEDSPAYRCWRRFLDGDSQYRNQRLKIIPYAVEGPWIVKKTVGSKPIPTLIGNKLTCTWRDNLDSRCLELYCDINSSIAANTILGVVKNACKTVVLDFAFLVEGQEEDELPERIIGIFRINRVDLNRIRDL